MSKRFPQRVKSRSIATDTLYYVARRDRDYPSALAALESVGFPGELAQQVIDNARINRSAVIVADIGDGKGVALTPLPSGGVTLWQAFLGWATSDRKEAESDGHLLAERLNDGSTLAVFECITPPSIALH